MDDGQVGAAGVVGYGDDLEFDAPGIPSQVQQLVTYEDGLAGVDQGGEDVGIADLVLPAGPSHPHSHRSSVSYTYERDNGFHVQAKSAWLPAVWSGDETPVDDGRRLEQSVKSQ